MSSLIAVETPDYVIDVQSDGASALEIDSILPADFQVVLSESNQGPPGSQELRVFQVIADDAAVTVDYANGSFQEIVLRDNVQALSVINWPVAGKAARLILQITNEGSFGISGWPNGTRWPLGEAPQISAGNGRVDIIVLTTGSGGAPIFGNTVGQDYQEPV